MTCPHHLALRIIRFLRNVDPVALDELLEYGTVDDDLRRGKSIFWPELSSKRPARYRLLGYSAELSPSRDLKPLTWCRLGHDTHVSITQEKVREILVNRFVLLPSADASAEERARHAVKMVTEPKSREGTRSQAGRNNDMGRQRISGCGRNDVDLCG